MPPAWNRKDSPGETSTCCGREAGGAQQTDAGDLIPTSPHTLRSPPMGVTGCGGHLLRYAATRRKSLLRADRRGLRRRPLAVLDHSRNSTRCWSLTTGNGLREDIDGPIALGVVDIDTIASMLDTVCETIPIGPGRPMLT